MFPLYAWLMISAVWMKASKEKLVCFSPLQKHAYSNILKIWQPEKEKNQIKHSDIFLISVQNIDCTYSLEPLRRGGSNEYPQSMFLCRNKKNNVHPCKPQFYCIKVGFKGAKLYRHVFVMFSLFVFQTLVCFSLSAFRLSEVSLLFAFRLSEVNLLFAFHILLFVFQKLVCFSLFAFRLSEVSMLFSFRFSLFVF